MDEHPLDGACCGSCAHAKRVAEGEVVHPASPALRVGAAGVVLVARHAGSALRVPLRVGQRVTVGRGAQNDVALPRDGSLSRVTCAVEVTGAGEVFVEDLQSSCGTLVNGARVVRSGLHELDEIRVGSSVLTFEPGDAA